MRPFSYCKLEIFLPASHLSPLETALRQVGPARGRQQLVTGE